MSKDGIMKHLFKPNTMKKLIVLFIVVVLIKALWVMVEVLWLPASGVTHLEEKGNKALYYRVKLTPNEAPAPSIKRKETKLKPAGSIKDIKLLAIYNASDTTVITIQYKSKTKVLAKGENINGFVLEGAGSDFALFSKNGKSYEVVLEKIKKRAQRDSPVQATSQRKSNSQKSVSSVPEGDVTDAGDHKIIDKSLFDHYAKNMDDIYKNIGIAEIKEGKKTKGFRISFVKKDSPFAKLGIQRNDIIKSVNGQSINSYNAAFGVYKNIQNVENLTLVIERGKEEMELEYEIN